MARVAPVQTPELRSAPQSSQQPKAGDPFSMLLDTVSNKRAGAPEPRRRPEAAESSPRVSAAEKRPRPEPKVDAKQASEKSKEAAPTAKDCDTAKNETISEDAPEKDTAAKPQNDADPVVADAAPVAAPAASIEDELNIDLSPESANAQAPAAEEGAAPVAGVSPDIDAAAAAPVQQAAPQAAAPDAEPVAVAPVAAPAADVSADAEAEAPAAAAAVQVSAPAATKPTPAASVSAEAEVTAQTTAQPGEETAKTEQPVQVQKPVTSNHADVREAVIAEKGEQQASAQTRSGAQETQVAPKEQAALKPSEQASAPLQTDNSAPRPQATPSSIPAMPEPVRALAGSINPVNLRVAADGPSNGVPLNNAAMAVEIASRAKDGARRFDIRLDPPELGRIDVRLEVDRSGKASTHLIVERPETLDLLQRDARNLERALQSAGLQTEEGGLEFSLQDQNQNGLADANSDRGFDRRSDFLASAIEDAEPATPAMERYAQSVFARGGVDIRI